MTTLHYTLHPAYLKRWLRCVVATAVTVLGIPAVNATESEAGATNLSELPSLRARAEIIDTVLEERINNVLPMIMERSGVDFWVVMSREYNEDPVLKTLLPAVIPPF